jgi:uncharacterized membrane protein YecN with MAPEG domain
MYITSLYAGILALFFVGLSVRTLRLRRRLRIPIGDAGNGQMLSAIRVHANFAEYVPLSLLLLYLMEVQAASSLMLHGLGTCLAAGRVLHAFGVSKNNEDYRFRVGGMALTLMTIVIESAYLLIAYTIRA